MLILHQKSVRYARAPLPNASLTTQNRTIMENENNAGEITPYNPSEENVVVYRTEDNSIQLQVKLENESVWLTQDQMAQLFDRDRTVIGRHIRSIFLEGELDESLSCAKFALPKKYGRRGGYLQEVETTIYNLDVIISVNCLTRPLANH